MEKSKELSNLNVVRTWLIVCIVFYHSALFWTGAWFPVPTEQTAPYLGWFALWLNSFHIYSFVFLSGYLFYYQRRELGKYNNFPQFVKNKFRRLIVPYIFVSVCWNIPFALYFNEDSFYLFTSYVLGRAPEQLWFLLMLFGVFVLFYTLEKFPFFLRNDKPSLWAFLICFFSFFIGIGGWFFVPNYFQIWRMFMYLFFFYLGYAARNGVLYEYLKTDNASLIRYAVLQIILFIELQFLLIPNPFLDKLIQQSFGYICHILGAFVAFHLLLKLAVFFDNKQKIIKKFSGYSFGIYLFHQQIIYLGLCVFVNRVSPIFTTAICFILSLWLSWLITRLLSNKYTSWLIGG